MLCFTYRFIIHFVILFFNSSLVDLQCCVNHFCNQQSDSVMHGYTFFSFFICFSTTVFHRILNIVLCAMQQDLVVYLSYIKSKHPLTPILHSIPPLISSPNNHHSIFINHFDLIFGYSVRFRLRIFFCIWMSNSFIPFVEIIIFTTDIILNRLCISVKINLPC